MDINYLQKIVKEAKKRGVKEVKVAVYGGLTARSPFKDAPEFRLDAYYTSPYYSDESELPSAKQFVTNNINQIDPPVLKFIVDLDNSTD